ncbi:hypothetical protein [Paraburkholderia humisilvae]|uniref:Uncharacterized protein n=1 Tax=Paraburkholderia humisilvae TaxID=627669 RepID=A0A6J5DMC5_9BURK|nr:hypothetical protein [Paraburkholderia humisilvae]CAB3753976.1 hypothetical protein LMG29542_02208 [Paraburkholderia humisilvae]
MQDQLANPDRKFPDDVVPATAPAEDLFSLALGARVESALMWLLFMRGDLPTEAFDGHRRKAFELACRAGYLYADEPIPHLLRDDVELREAWAHGVARRDDERRNGMDDAMAVDREPLIIARDWYALGLPFPEQILSNLRCGEICHVCGHNLYPEGGTVFFDNPRGQLGVFGGLHDLTLADLEVFLTHMARRQTWTVRSSDDTGL